MTARRANAAFALAVLVYSALLWWPTRELPYHWDSATFVARAARDLLARDFQPFVAYFSFFAHPPLFIAALALCIEWFGEGLRVAHALIFPFLPLLLLSTYTLGAQVYARAVGAAAAALVGTAAVVVAEYGQIYFDLPLAALLTAALSLWLHERRLAASVLLGVCAGIKIPALVIPCALLAAELVRGGKGTLRRVAPLATPFAVVAVWLVYHHSVEGFWLRRPPLRNHMATSALELLGNARAVIFYLTTQGRWAGVALGLAALSAALVRRRPTLAELRERLRPSTPPVVVGGEAFGTLALLFVVGVGVAFFALAGEFAERYGIILMPAIALLSAAALHARLSARAPIYWALVGLLCAIQLREWYPDDPAPMTFQLRPDADLRYLDVIALGRETARYMAREHPTAHVYGSWPETYWLGEPYLGYTERPFAVDDCRAYRADVPGEKVIFGHLYAGEQHACWRLVQRLGARPIEKLQVGEKWIQIHLAP